MPTKIGTMSINIHVNFTNYGSALQTWALHRAIERVGDSMGTELQPVLVDYCPDCLAGKDVRNPLSFMWDTDEASQRNCRLSLPPRSTPTVRSPTNRLNRSRGAYTSENFEKITAVDGISRFVCGSDTIFCPDEFDGFERGYYADYDCMRGRQRGLRAELRRPAFLGGRLSTAPTRGFPTSWQSACARTSCCPTLRATRMSRRGAWWTPRSCSTRTTMRRSWRPASRRAAYVLLLSAPPQPRDDGIRGAPGWAKRLGRRGDIPPRRERLAAPHGVRRGRRGVPLAGQARSSSLVTNSFHGMIFGYQFRTPFYAFAEQANSKIGECRLPSALRTDSWKALGMRLRTP